jgi:hypothetical protein
LLLLLLSVAHHLQSCQDLRWLNLKLHHQQQYQQQQWWDCRAVADVLLPGVQLRCVPGPYHGLTLLLLLLYLLLLHPQQQQQQQCGQVGVLCGPFPCPCCCCQPQHQVYTKPAAAAAAAGSLKAIFAGVAADLPVWVKQLLLLLLLLLPLLLLLFGSQL